MINPFRKPSALRLAVEELEDAQRSLLSASSAAEYAQAIAQYNRERIARLRRVIEELGTERAGPARSVPQSERALDRVNEAPQYLPDSGGYVP